MTKIDRFNLSKKHIINIKIVMCFLDRLKLIYTKIKVGNVKMVKIYLANLGKYNENCLVGQWVELPISEEDLNNVFVKIGLGKFDEDGEYVHGLEIDGVMYEEYAIHDYDTDIKGLKIGEYDSIKSLNELAETVEDKEEEFSAICEVYGSDFSYCLDILKSEDYTFYEGMSLEDVAEEIVTECYDLPDFALAYFDYEKFARDLSYDNYYEVSNGTIVLR